MTMGTLTSVFQRIDAIESRFGRTAPRSGALPRTASSLDFEALLEQSAAPVRLDPVSEEGVAPAAVPIGAVPSTWSRPQTTDIGSLLDGLGPLATLGALPVAVPGIGGAPPPDVASSMGVVDGATVATIAAPTSTSGTAQGVVAPGTPFAAQFEQAGIRHGVPPRLLAAVGWVESRYQVDALSPDGAIGVMQIMPMTAQELGVDPHDPVDAIDGAARLLASHQRRFGSWDLALAAYHSGAGAVSRAGNQAPPRAATYVERVRARLEHA